MGECPDAAMQTTKHAKQLEEQELVSRDNDDNGHQLTQAPLTRQSLACFNKIEGTEASTPRDLDEGNNEDHLDDDIWFRLEGLQKRYSRPRPLQASYKHRRDLRAAR